MKKYYCLQSFLALIMLIIVDCSRSNSPNYQRLMKTKGAEFVHIPVGLCEDYPEETTTMEIISNDMELLKRTGVDLLRISFGWDAIEAQKDQYDWLFWDDYVKTAVNQYGITLIPYICYTPLWNSRGDTLWFWNDQPLDFEEFGEFMYDLVTRYKKYIKTWELWNEPDLDIYWDTRDVAAFAEFIKIGAQAVRRADPEAKVVLGGMAYHADFLEQLFRDYGLSPYIDIVNMHNYYETWSERPVEKITENINAMAEVIKKYGDDQSLWMAEVGYSTFRQGSYVSDSYYAYYDYEHTPEYQAVDLFKRLTLAVAEEKLSAIAWYEIKDLPAGEEVIGDNYNNRYLGIAYADYKPKPAEKALVFFRKLFGNPYRNVTSLISVELQPDSDVFYRAFEKEDGTIIFVAWIATNVPSKRPLKPANLVQDTRTETISVTIPAKLKGQVVQYNELGSASTFNEFQRNDDQTRLNNIVLNGGEIKIFELEK